jgi:hypothetical protein
MHRDELFDLVAQMPLAATPQSTIGKNVLQVQAEEVRNLKIRPGSK